MRVSTQQLYSCALLDKRTAKQSLGGSQSFAEKQSEYTRVKGLGLYSLDNILPGTVTSLMNQKSIPYENGWVYLTLSWSVLIIPEVERHRYPCHRPMVVFHPA